MPSYNGVPLFGIGAKIRTSDNPRSVQENSFPGVSGVESLDLGMRGRITEATGLLVGDSALELANLLTQFRSYNDGNTYLLVDSLGFTWPYVRLVSFEPDPGGIMVDSYGRHMQVYRATFKHLA